MANSKKNLKEDNNIQDQELENFIEDWHWDKPSHKLAKEMGSFLFQFIEYLESIGLSEKSISKHIDNCWCIGKLELDYGYHDSFSPDIFSGDEPSSVIEFKRKFSGSKYAINSYKATWRKLTKYVKENKNKWTT